MKQLILAVSCLMTTISFSQQTEILQIETTNQAAESAPIINHKPIFGPKANWDINFSADVSTAANGTLGQAGVAFHNNMFWTTMWASDTLIQYSSAGAFIQKLVIPGVSGARAITSDGTNLYISNATNSIYVVNPTTTTLTSTITSSAAVTSRFLTYDATLNAGSGGFWTGNFNTDIVSIDMSGAVLSTIPVATHTLGGMYGATVDNVSPGGPYLWVFHQGGANSCTFTALQLPSGTPTVHTRDAFLDMTTPYSLTSGLSGGAFLSADLVPGEISLIGLLQGTPVNVIVAYELDLSATLEDVQVTTNQPVKGYTKIPLTQIFTETFDIGYQNNGTSTVDTIYVDVDYFHNGSIVFSETLLNTNVASAGTGTLSSTYTPTNGLGIYDAFATVRPNAAISDSNPLNDTLTFTFEVTDSTFARDNSIPTGTPYVVSNTDTAYVTANFEIMATDTLTGIWVQLTTPTHGDTTFAVLYDFDGSSPSTAIAFGEINIIDSNQTEYYLRFPESIILTPGTYSFGCFESVTGINLSQSNNVFTAGTNFFYTPGGGWSASGIPTARFIRPILGMYFGADAGINESLLANMSIYPVPATEEVTIDFSTTLVAEGELIVTDITGAKITSKKLIIGTEKMTLNTSNYSTGVYILNFNIDGQQTARRITVK